MDRDRRLAEMTREIPLNNGMVAIVDAIDYDAVVLRTWHVVTKHGIHYARTSEFVNGKNVAIYMHHLVSPKQHGLDADHRNGDGLDNRRSNIRYCTRTQNNMNRRVQKRRAAIKSKYKGVYWCRTCWQAGIAANGEKHYLGAFSTEEEAANAYNIKAKELHGEFAKLNRLPLAQPAGFGG